MIEDRGAMIVRSTRGELINFKRSLLAKDIRREMLIWKRLCYIEYEKATTMLEKGMVDGKLFMISEVFEIVNSMITDLDMIEEVKKEEEERDRVIKEEEEEDGDRRNETDES